MKLYAKLGWTAGDVQTLRPDWTLEQCAEWLSENEQHMRDRLCEHGWEVMEALLPMSMAAEAIHAAALELNANRPAEL